jgi:hypothetical protein
MVMWLIILSAAILPFMMHYLRSKRNPAQKNRGPK